MISNWVPFWTPQITSSVESPFIETGQLLTVSLQNSCCMQQPKLPAWLANALKMTPPWMFFWITFVEVEKKIVEKCVIVAKWYWWRVTKFKKEYWGVFEIDILFFHKKICKAKIKFLQYKCRDADAEKPMLKFQNGLRKQVKKRLDCFIINAYMYNFHYKCAICQEICAHVFNKCALYNCLY